MITLIKPKTIILYARENIFNYAYLGECYGLGLISSGHSNVHCFVCWHLILSLMHQAQVSFMKILEIESLLLANIWIEGGAFLNYFLKVKTKSHKLTLSSLFSSSLDK